MSDHYGDPWLMNTEEAREACEALQQQLAACAVGAREERHGLQKRLLNSFRVAKDLSDQLAACAAGAWNYDLSEAPQDGKKVLLMWRSTRLPKSSRPDIGCGWYYDDVAGWEMQDGGFVHRAHLIAFAIINPSAERNE